MTEKEKEENEESEKKGVMFFGVDLMKIECMRGSLLNGYAGAAAGAVGGFMYTSKPKIACHAAFASFWIVAFPSWFFCRYQKYVRERKLNLIQKTLNEQIDFSKDEYHLPKEFRKSEGNAEATPGKKS